MSSIKYTAKFLDQPLLTSSISKSIPLIMTGGLAGFAAYDSYESSKENKPQNLLNKACVLCGTVTSALIATRGLSIKGHKVFNGLFEALKPAQIQYRQTRFINRFWAIIEKNPHLNQGFKNSAQDKNITELLEKAKSQILKPNEINKLDAVLSKDTRGKKLLEKLIPPPDDFSSKQIFSEILSLSALGAVPVIGGVAGGSLGDLITGEHSSKKSANRIKEGFYQYFANIMLCNVGAGLSVGALEVLNKAKVIEKPSRLTKMLSMSAGIMAVGVVGGSAIANYLAQKLINPLFGHKKGNNLSIKKLYNERSPEALDLALHVDDFATVGALTGLRWIGPLLPVIYSVSGYRAGMGYRNGSEEKELPVVQNRKDLFKNTFKPFLIQK